MLGFLKMLVLLWTETFVKSITKNMTNDGFLFFQSIRELLRLCFLCLNNITWQIARLWLVDPDHRTLYLTSDSLLRLNRKEGCIPELEQRVGMRRGMRNFKGRSRGGHWFEVPFLILQTFLILNLIFNFKF